MIRLHLLGPLQIDVEGKAAALASRKSRALIAYLALRRGEAVPRETLVGLLWGERGEEQARASLRQALSALRKALGEAAAAALVASNETVRLAVEGLWVDVEVLERLGDSSPLEDLEAAVALYRGELLEGFALEEPAFDQWLAAERERTRLLFSRLLSSLVDRLERDHRIEDAIAQAARLVALDPLQERVHRTLMRLYVAQGRHDAALSQFEQCRRELAAQLDVSPEKETLDLVAEVRARRRQSSGSAKVVEESPPQTSSRPQSDKPSIAVLPFTNLSGDPEQEHFADGIAEDILTMLSRFHGIVVIARNSSFHYRGEAKDLHRVSQELGVRYLLQGSVRKLAERVRVSARLVEAESGNLLWAERYNRDLEDVFEIQDEITQKIVGAITPELLAAEMHRVRRKPRQDLGSWDYVMRGSWYQYRFTKADNAEAQRLFKMALGLDPENAQALGCLAISHFYDNIFGWSDSGKQSSEQAFQAAQKALTIDDREALALTALGLAQLYLHRHDEAAATLERAIDANPSLARAHAMLGLVLAFADRRNEAIPHIEMAFRLSPHDPMRMGWCVAMATANRWRNPEEAIEWGRKAVQIRADFPSAHRSLATDLALAGQMAEAREALGNLLRLLPDATVESTSQQLAYKNPKHLQAVLEALRKAGLPE